MRQIYFIFGFLLIAMVSHAQQIGISRNEVSAIKIDKRSIIFDQENGQSIKFERLNGLFKSYPNATLIVKDEDENGNPLSYLFVKNSTFESISNGWKERVEIVRNDIYGELFNSVLDASKYSLIILQLDLEYPIDPVFPGINLETIKEAENAALRRNLTSVLLTCSGLESSKGLAQEYHLKSIIIPNARTLIEKFGSRRFPMYYILDKDKNIVSSLKYAYEVEDALKLLD